MKIQYIFRSSEGMVPFDVDLDRVMTIVPPQTDWEALGCNQCEHCTLPLNDNAVCPAARDLRPIIDQFSSVSPANIISVEVITPERRYEKEALWQEGLKSLIGLVLATSQCPILGTLRSTARFHLPFATPSEFVMRSASMYLLKQHFVRKGGEVPDWDFIKMRAFNLELQALNKSLWQRFLNAGAGEAILNAMLGFFEMSSALSHGLELHLQKIRPMFG